MRKFKNLNDLKKQAVNDDQLREEIKNDPLKFFSEIQSNPYMDKTIFKGIVWFVGILLILSFSAGVFYIFLRGGDSEVPTFFVTICSTALGALVGLLSPSPVSDSE